MKVIGLTDLHGNTHGFESISDELATVDLVLLTGDISHFGHERDVSKIIDQLLRYNEQVYAVAGNCDFPDVSVFLQQRNMNIHAKCIQFKQFSLIGLEGSLSCPGHTPIEYSEEELTSFLVAATRGNDRCTPFIMVSHQPPINTINDTVSVGRHVGSRSVRSFIEQEQPLICFTGHIHEGVGIDSIGKTKIVNPGPFKDGGYALANITSEQAFVEIKNWRS